MQPKLGVLAGGGALPRMLVDVCRASGREVFVVALDGQADAAAYSDVPHAVHRMGAAGDILDALKGAGVEEIVMAGPVRRPSVSELRPDGRAAKIIAKIGMRAVGDDGLLTAVAGVLEEEGFRVTGVDSLLDGLRAPAGPFGRLTPDEQAKADIERGLDVAAGLGSLDVGQAVVVQEGLVLGVEAAEGTAALIERCAGLRREGPGGVLVKISKPGQDRRLDLPTIGIETVEAAAAAGLAGIAVEAVRTLVIDRPGLTRLADDKGLFVIGVEGVG